jgi:hypothetical protein
VRVVILGQRIDGLAASWKGTTGPHVARSDPAADRRLLESGANGVGYLSVLRRVGDENIMRHGETESFDFTSSSRTGNAIMRGALNLTSFLANFGVTT